MSINGVARKCPLERTLMAFFAGSAQRSGGVSRCPFCLHEPAHAHLAATDRYPVPATLVLVGILLVIAVGMVSVLQHWRWLF
ncbi:MAG TPA: hypothetical protein VF026_10100 [Ktedonobacteraceae bacterium]